MSNFTFLAAHFPAIHHPMIVGQWHAIALQSPSTAHDGQTHPITHTQTHLTPPHGATA